MSASNSKLTIDLRAIASNWSSLNSLSGTAACAAVVKADAYGLGVQRVADTLWAAGCREFFVATVQEGEQLRACLPVDATIYILSGFFDGEVQRCLASRLTPVIVSLPMLEQWSALDAAAVAPVALKIDTGMGRFGLSLSEFDLLLAEPSVLANLNVTVVMSHLACADEPDHPLNTLQLDRFSLIKQTLGPLLPAARFSLANSAGIRLGSEYHFDLVRPGIALYGGRQADGGQEFAPSPVMSAVVGLMLKVVQVRTMLEGESVGYGATYKAYAGQRIATTAGGYADGIFRSLSNSGAGYCGSTRVPMVGRVSMDSMAFDVSKVNEVSLQGVFVELLGEHQGIDELALAAGTTSYEVLTSLGERFHRVYVEG